MINLITYIISRFIYGTFVLFLGLNSFALISKKATPIDTIKTKNIPPIKEIKYPFVKYEKNSITHPDTAKNLTRFCANLDSLIKFKKKKINIVHIGDSHIQADFFSGRIRDNFHADTLTGNGGRGFIFPHTAIKSQNSTSFKVNYTGKWIGCKNTEAQKKCDLGIAGISATTYDFNASITINTNLNNLYQYPTTKVKVFYTSYDPNTYQPRLLVGGKLISPQKIYPEGGYAEFVLEKSNYIAVLKLQKTKPNQKVFVLQGISLENDLPGIQYHAMGINGAAVTSFLRCNNLENNLKALRPDLVIISLGTNDAYGRVFNEEQFKKNYEKLIKRVKKASPQTAIILTTPADCFLRGCCWNPNTKKTRKKIFELADTYDTGVWDLFTIMGGLGSISTWYLNKLAASDLIHFSKKGYYLQGDLFYTAIMKLHKQYKSKPVVEKKLKK